MACGGNPLTVRTHGDTPIFWGENTNSTNSTNRRSCKSMLCRVSFCLSHPNCTNKRPRKGRKDMFHETSTLYSECRAWSFFVLSKLTNCNWWGGYFMWRCKISLGKWWWYPFFLYICIVNGVRVNPANLTYQSLPTYAPVAWAVRLY